MRSIAWAAASGRDSSPRPAWVLFSVSGIGRSDGQKASLSVAHNGNIYTDTDARARCRIHAQRTVNKTTKGKTRNSIMPKTFCSRRFLTEHYCEKDFGYPLPWYNVNTLESQSVWYFSDAFSVVAEQTTYRPENKNSGEEGNWERPGSCSRIMAKR